ncbi:MAG: hypothetical protein QM752_00165 [Gammaproteobacteria bacterium]
MGFFDFFKLIKKRKKQSVILNNNQKNESILLMPTVEPEKELFECYDEVFMNMTKDISGISIDEAFEILSIIKKVDGGFINMGYYTIIWEKYFKEKDWSWGEYEEWYNVFCKLGKFPSRFLRKSDFLPSKTEDVLSELKVNDLKILCREKQVIFPSKVKKKDLINMLKSIPNINKSLIVVKKIDELYGKFNYELYSLYMRTMSFRARNLYNIRGAKKRGIRKFEIFHVFEEDKEFVEMALKKNPNLLHPVFPSDLSSKQPIFDF